MGQRPFNPFKAITIVFITAAIAAGGYFGYQYYEKFSEPISPALNAIPENTAFFIELKKHDDFWEKVSNNNFWELLQSFSDVKEAKLELLFLDSVLNVAKVENQIQLPEKFYLASFISDSLQLQSLFLFNIKDNFDKELVVNQVKKCLPKQYPIVKNDLFGNTVFSCEVDSSRHFVYTLFKGVFICGFEIELVKSAMIQLQSEQNLRSIAAFNRVYNSSGKHADATLFVQLPVFQKVIGSLVSQENATGIFDNFAQWTGLDMQVGENDLVFNGFTAAKDSLSDFLACFYKQKPQNNNIIEILPSNTVYFVNYSFRDFETFYTRYQKHLLANSRLESYEAKIAKFEKEYSCNVSEGLLDWIGTEMCYVISAGKKITKDNRFAIINLLDRYKADTFFKKIRDNRKRSIIEYKDFKIYKLKGKSLLSVFFGDLFTDFEANYYCRIGEYIVFSGSLTGAKQFINKHLYHKTLTSNLYFKEFAELIPGESNIFLYCNVYHAADIFGNSIFNDRIGKTISDSIDAFKKIQAFAVQLNTDNKLFYSNIAAKFNADYKSEPSIIWETKLDTVIAHGPYLVANHEDMGREIFITDVGNTIYLLDNSGEIIWKRHLESAILGKPVQIDFFKNKKLQYVFNTADSLYIVDRNGKDVEEYPIKLKKKMSAPVAVFDYEDKKEYRFLVPLENKEILNLDKDGNKILGWEYKRSARKVREPLQHFLMERIDYITITQNNHQVEIVNRRGDEKFKKMKLQIAENSSIYSLSENDVAPSLVTTDSKSNVLRVYMETGKIKKWFKPLNMGKNHYFVFKDYDLDGLKDFIFLSDKKLKVYNQQKKNIFSFNFKNKIASAPIYFQTPDTTIKIGVTDKKAKELYLFTCEGKLKNGFPLKGDTRFVVDYLDDTGILNLVAGNENTVLCFEIVE